MATAGGAARTAVVAMGFAVVVAPVAAVAVAPMVEAVAVAAGLAVTAALSPFPTEAAIFCVGSPDDAAAEAASAADAADAGASDTTAEAAPPAAAAAAASTAVDWGFSVGPPDPPPQALNAVVMAITKLSIALGG